MIEFREGGLASELLMSSRARLIEWTSWSSSSSSSSSAGSASQVNAGVWRRMAERCEDITGDISLCSALPFVLPAFSLNNTTRHSALPSSPLPAPIIACSTPPNRILHARDIFQLDRLLSDGTRATHNEAPLCPRRRRLLLRRPCPARREVCSRSNHLSVLC